MSSAQPATTETPRKYQLFIDGKWVDAESGKTFTTPNPATGATLAEVAERIRRAIDQLPPTHGKVKVSASIGFAVSPVDGQSGRELIQAADQRMYEDKYNRRRNIGKRRPEARTVMAVAN